MRVGAVPDARMAMVVTACGLMLHDRVDICGAS